MLDVLRSDRYIPFLVIEFYKYHDDLEVKTKFLTLKSLQNVSIIVEKISDEINVYPKNGIAKT